MVFLPQVQVKLALILVAQIQQVFRLRVQILLVLTLMDQAYLVLESQ